MYCVNSISYISYMKYISYIYDIAVIVHKYYYISHYYCV